jgi:glucose/arabinose dehydrogenase
MIFVTGLPTKSYIMKYFLLVFGMIALSFILSCEKDDDDPPGEPVVLRDTVLVSNLNFPWEILWGPDGFIWMTERGGKISRVNPATGAVTSLLTITEVKNHNGGEGGLLGMVLHPNFSANQHVFVAYNYYTSGTTAANYKVRVVRYTYTGTALTSPMTIVDSIQGNTNHNGCRLLITPDLKLFISTGDAENTSLPQNATSINGKILRVNLDGSVPSDNPTPGSRIWSLGHRNPQGLVYANNILYSSEHGPNNDDEINIIEKGRNYGWPNVPGKCDPGSEQTFCTANTVREPIQIWTPTIAPSGMDYYDKDAIPQFKNSLLLATLKNRRLYQLKLNSAHNGVDSVTEFYFNKYGRMRDIAISPEGKVYICTSNGNNSDRIIEVSAKNN